MPTQNKMPEGSEGKVMCHTSARFHVIILITWNLIKCSLHQCALNITGEEAGQSKNMN